jgi:predicted RNA-binding Zn-ribbon protein involved in translation (DUF1610 family)
MDAKEIQLIRPSGVQENAERRIPTIDRAVLTNCPECGKMCMLLETKETCLRCYWKGLKNV